MKQIILMLMFFTLALNAEKIEFSGNYHSDTRDVVPTFHYGFVEGCIYNGKNSNGKLIKVYTKNACNINTGKKRISGIFICYINDIDKKEIKKNYTMYEGTCEVKK
jgi:hypothetical protein